VYEAPPGQHSRQRRLVRRIIIGLALLAVLCCCTSLFYNYWPTVRTDWLGAPTWTPRRP
jgi:hypothetical protein